MSFSSFFLFWLILEINRLMFLYYSYAFGNSGRSKSDYFQHGLFYFITQSFFSILLLIGLYSSSDNSFFYRNFLIVFLVLVFKLSLFPIEGWILRISKYLNSTLIFVLLTLQKLPLIIFSLNIFRSWVLVYILFSRLARCFLIFYSNSLVNILIYSSIYTNFWLVLAYLFDSFFFLMFYLFSYIPVVLILCGVINQKKSNRWIELIFCLCFLCALPPFSFFLLKFNLFFNILLRMNLFFLFLGWLLGFISLASYYKFFYCFFLTQNRVYAEKYSWKSPCLVLLLSVLFLFYLEC